MSVLKKFEGSNASRYNNSLHVAYHMAQLLQLQALGRDSLETMYVSGEALESYVMTVGDLTERSLEALTSAATGDTTALDVEYDHLLSMLFFLVASRLLSAEAATTLRLNEILTQLEAANNKFEEVKEARAKDCQAKHLQVKTSEIRLLVDSQLEEKQTRNQTKEKVAMAIWSLSR